MIDSIIVFLYWIFGCFLINGSHTTSKITLSYVSNNCEGLDIDRCSLDLYYPSPLGSTLNSLVILLHGGLWQTGDKSSFDTLCRNIIASSSYTISCASVNYPYSQDIGGACNTCGHAFISQIKYAGYAYAFLQMQAHIYGLNNSRFWLGGHSAGGHLAVYAAIMWDTLLTFTNYSVPLGFIGIEGIYSIPRWNNYDLTQWSGQFSCATQKAFGLDSCSPNYWQLGSPTFQVTDIKRLPVGSLLLVHSPDDDWVSYSQVNELYGALNGSNTEISIDGRCGIGSHFGILADNKLTKCIIDFVLPTSTSTSPSTPTSIPTPAPTLSSTSTGTRTYVNKHYIFFCLLILCLKLGFNKYNI